jgi:hypothetical protein
MTHGAGRAAAVVAVSICAWVFAPPALAEVPDRTVTVTPESQPGWDGDLSTGTNTSYDSASGEPCTDSDASPDERCDKTLLQVQVPTGYWDTNSGGVRVNLGNYLPLVVSDFDLYIYESDASGNRGQLVDSSGDVPGMPESAEIPNADGYYLVQVVYFAVISSRYSATTEFFSRTAHAATPPDIDDPPGLQDFLASNPSLGYRSHSEPHIAQSPTNPNLLVAASKQYNKDPDSLAEYEFKIGSYVSFDRGKTWTDLGQTDVCPAADAPPESWPNNDCYPADNPNEEGTGAEDEEPTSPILQKLDHALGDIGEDEGTPDRETRGNDYGEEYITSDAWVQFDDEGNAYLMVLDSPPFEHGNGWGMSFHRWETPSPTDIKRGSTWSKKIVINNYSNEETQPLFLDDKNTFAVNNAGSDNDGSIGTMVACWGQNIPDAIKQQTVCERSTDGGRSWPGEPIPISEAQHLVIGVSVVADSVNPNRFYATWLHYVPGVIGQPDELWFSQSLDGGQTWTPATLVSRLEGVPTQFPGQQFRNLSIPIMAAGPTQGELYITYADYRPASSETDEDGKQADTMLVKSTGGLTWSAPQVVNKDTGDADQFQPFVAVTPAGQLNVSWFDRRHDPDNFFIDTYLARSNDGGSTFTETRVSHDMWDPDINPPVSPSGEFIGDYQGLVADNCFAIPFVNDTHLANDASRDPDFDKGEPRSQFQEVFAWRVPNTAAFGGQPVTGTTCPTDTKGGKPPRR